MKSLIHTHDDIDGFDIRIERFLQIRTLIDERYGGLADVIDHMKDASNNLLDCGEDSKKMLFFIETYQSSQRGRPKFALRKELQFHLEHRFSILQIGKMLNISERTIKRRLKEFSLSIKETYSEISNVDLDSFVLSTLKEFPNTGYKRMKGFLLSKNIRD